MIQLALDLLPFILLGILACGAIAYYAYFLGLDIGRDRENVRMQSFVTRARMEGKLEGSRAAHDKMGLNRIAKELIVTADFQPCPIDLASAMLRAKPSPPTFNNMEPL